MCAPIASVAHWVELRCSYLLLGSDIRKLVVSKLIWKIVMHDRNKALPVGTCYQTFMLYRSSNTLYDWSSNSNSENYRSIEDSIGSPLFVMFRWVTFKQCHMDCPCTLSFSPTTCTVYIVYSSLNYINTHHCRTNKATVTLWLFDMMPDCWRS